MIFAVIQHNFIPLHVMLDPRNQGRSVNFSISPFEVSLKSFLLERSIDGFGVGVPKSMVYVVIHHKFKLHVDA